MPAISGALGIAAGVTSGLAVLALIVVATMFVLLARTRKREREIQAAGKAADETGNKDVLTRIAADVDPEHNIPVEKLTAKAAAEALMERMRLRALNLRSLLSQAIWAFVICFVFAIVAQVVAGVLNPAPPPPAPVPAPAVQVATLNQNGDVAYTLDSSNLDVPADGTIKLEFRRIPATDEPTWQRDLGGPAGYPTVIQGAFSGLRAGEYEVRYLVTDRGSPAPRAGPWTRFSVPERP